MSMRSARIGLAVPNHRVLIVALTAVLTLFASPPRFIAADENEVIVTIEVIDTATGAPVTDGFVQLGRPGGPSRAFGHREHTTVEEGEVLTVKAVPSTGWQFHSWQGLARGAQAESIVSFRTDTIIRLLVSPENTASGVVSESISDGASAPDASAMVSAGAPQAGGPVNNLAPTLHVPRTGGVVWVDFHYLGSEDGSQSRPFNTLAKGVAALGVLSADTISFKPGSTPEAPRLNTAVILNAPNGLARIGTAGAPVSFTLTTSVSGSGTVTGASVYGSGTTAAINATTSGGWAFSNWTGDLTGFVNPTTVLMDRNKSVNAVFVLNPAGLRVTGATLQGGGALPTVAKSGDTFTIEWTVQNNSGNAASSGDTNWTDNVFLSRDTVFGPDDKPLSVSGATITGPVGASNTYVASAQITIPDVSPSAYFLIVRTDIGGEVSHTAAGRAAGILAIPLTIKDPELTL